MASQRPPLAVNYTICSRLSYSTITCGVNANRRDFDDNGSKYKVPNIVHMIWFQNPKFEYYNYLAIRSIASIHRPEKIIIHYNVEKPRGELWDRLTKEIPCLDFDKMETSSEVLGVKITSTIAKTDAARIQILLKLGGIYIDNDVITLKDLGPLRKFSVTMGRSVKEVISMGIIIAEPNSTFLLKFYQQYPTHYSDSLFFFFTTRFVKKFYQANLEKGWIKVEETSMQRSNPYLSQEGGTRGATLAHFDLSYNYFLHIHPSKAKSLANVFSWRDEVVRKMDNVCGEAARVAFFGSPDLIFKPGEKAQNRVPTRPIIPFPPITTS